MEIWKPIPGYEGYYEASNMGRIRSVERQIEHKRYPGKLVRRTSRILRNATLTNGYKAIALSKGNKKFRHKVHRIIALTFIPNPDNLPCIDHINGKRYDNRPENLRWCTVRQNAFWREESKGHVRNQSRTILCKETGGTFKTSYEAAEWVNKKNMTNSTNWKTIAGNIRDACKFDKRTAYGFHWAYSEGSETISKESREKSRNGEPRDRRVKI